MRISSLTTFALVVLMGCRTTILQDLSEAQAAMIVSKLLTSGIDADKEIQASGKWGVIVDEANRRQSISLLQTTRLLPEDRSDHGMNDSLFLSTQQKHLQYERSLSRSIEESIRNIPGVFDARIHVNLPIKEGLRRNQSPEESQSSGSILVIAAENYSTSEREIATLIGGAVGIPPDRVTVLVTKEGAAVKTRVMNNGNINGSMETPWLGSKTLGLVVGGVGALGVILGILLKQRPKVIITKHAR